MTDAKVAFYDFESGIYASSFVCLIDYGLCFIFLLFHLIGTCTGCHTRVNCGESRDCVEGCYKGMYRPVSVVILIFQLVSAVLQLTYMIKIRKIEQQAEQAEVVYTLKTCSDALFSAALDEIVVEFEKPEQTSIVLSVILAPVGILLWSAMVFANSKHVMA